MSNLKGKINKIWRLVRCWGGKQRAKSTMILLWVTGLMDYSFAKIIVNFSKYLLTLKMRFIFTYYKSPLTLL